MGCAGRHVIVFAAQQAGLDAMASLLEAKLKGRAGVRVSAAMPAIDQAAAFGKFQKNKTCRVAAMGIDAVQVLL